MVILRPTNDPSKRACGWEGGVRGEGTMPMMVKAWDAGASLGGQRELYDALGGAVLRMADRVTSR